MSPTPRNPAAARVAPRIGVLVALMLGLGAGIASATPAVMEEEQILRVADGWKDRVFLVVADGGPYRVPVGDVLADPSKLFRKRRVGCAVYLDERRLLLATASVVENGPEVEIFDEAGGHYLARLIGRDEHLDLALLETLEDLPGTESLPPLEIGEPPEPGSACMVLGNAWGRSLSATLGRIGTSEEIMPQGLPVRVVRVRAPIFPGDSGAPVLDAAGRIVGFLTAVPADAVLPGSGPVLEGAIGEFEIADRHRRPAAMAGFAMPAADARRAWQDLREFGHVRRGYLGVRMALASVGDGEGASILGVLPGSPAERIGIRAGDVIIGFDDQPVTNARQFCAMVAGTPPRSRLELHFLRDRVEHMISVEIGEASRTPGLVPLETAPAETLPAAAGPDMVRTR